jgi:hypothetical protein
MLGLVAWAVVIGGFVVVEGVALVRPHDQWPAFSDVMRIVTASNIGRWALFALWLWLGWHLFVRGWQFFLRAPAQPKAPNAGTGRSAALAPVAMEDLLRHDVIPLLFVYVVVLAMLRYCARVLRAQRDDSSRRSGARAYAERGWGPLLRHIVVTSTCGYVLFVVVVGLIYGLVAEVTMEFLRDAVVGGGFLAFVVAVPFFVALSWVTNTGRAR